ncbi:orexin receptor type 1-like isoform X2 [Pecten maximus]|uniref:orexin receptor type 1-like isoform X2 n=1 Tax=Pecten maximus TaxID=6579 RepID=UPI001458B3BC|nr:orexin receptor type 1-like isoform X2 [Pecten maximus]
MTTSGVNVTQVYPENETISQYDWTPEEWHAKVREYIFPDVYEWVFVALYVIVFTVGLGGNFIVCYAVWKNKHLRTVTNYFLVNLACADFIVILVCLPFTLVQDISQSWLFGLVMCKLVIYVQQVSVLVSVLTLTAISMERYMAICHPLSFRVSKYKSILVIGMVWLLSMLVAVPNLVFLTLFPDNIIPSDIGNIWLTACMPADLKTEFVYQLFLTVAYYLLPLFIMGFTYIRIAVCLWKSTLAGPATNNIASDSNAATLRNRKRTAKMLIMVVVLFSVCYLPVYMLNILRYAGLMDKTPELTVSVITLTARFLCYFNSAINPVIYNFMSEKFKKEFRVVCWCCLQLNYRRNQRGTNASRTQNHSSEDQSGMPLRRYETSHTTSSYPQFIHRHNRATIYKDGSLDYSDSRTEMTRLKPSNHGSRVCKDTYYNGSPAHHPT